MHGSYCTVFFSAPVQFFTSNTEASVASALSATIATSDFPDEKRAFRA
jgi:hypothetical protein